MWARWSQWRDLLALVYCLNIEPHVLPIHFILKKPDSVNEHHQGLGINSRCARPLGGLDIKASSWVTPSRSWYRRSRVEPQEPSEDPSERSLPIGNATLTYGSWEGSSAWINKGREVLSCTFLPWRILARTHQTRSELCVS